MESWKPKIEKGPAPLYERIADAIQHDIHAERLAPGTRLPAHRDLAHALSIGTGTVTKAYGEAERRGLLSSQVGRGSFVTAAKHEPGQTAAGPVDLAYNFPPVGLTSRYLAEAMGRLWRRQDFAATSRYTAPEGLDSARAAALRWIRERHALDVASTAHLIQTNGGQHGLSLVLQALCRSGDTVLCEAATFHGLKLVARAGNLKLEGIALDSEGLVPEALEKAAASTGSKVLYLVPTLQNPTACTMTAGRRREIAAIARRHQLFIIEDDAYRAIAGAGSPAALADLAPERTFYIASVSKSISPGLRLAFVLAPDLFWRERILNNIVAAGYAPPAQNALIFAQWVEDGIVDTLLGQVLAEMQWRTAMALRILGKAASAPGADQTLHLWLPLGSLQSERAYGRALRSGIQVTPPDAPLVGQGIHGLRVCLGSVADRSVLQRALEAVLRSLGEELPGSSAIV
ncbi:PLP-dependent aminotransferase family protein [Mesorhizobium sp. B2-3-4]|uniref:aminotransferase-like domain-containing protein n=1 Tax=Mesorhizobium sp. B2-3-4 TaxID=2589959 RepID=UPI001AED7710|nr:PLP-dependent aminotransferase family protein [Mesorhizobium sp. B2-3-4]